jgi:glycosyltransferase involved in cell wall biosynthesis
MSSPPADANASPSAPRVSVVIPSFNCGSCLADAIGSVLAQTRQDFEIIIVDDGSTDDTRAVVDSYRADPRIRYLHQDNRGLPGARNAGLLASAAPYVLFLDADDALDPGAVAALETALDHSGAGWAVVDVLKIRSDQHEIHRSDIPPGDLFYGILADDFVRRGMFFRRTELIDIGMYDEEMKNREDWDVNIRMLRAGKPFTYVAEPLYIYNWRSGSITTGNPGKMLAYTEKLLRKHHKRLADSGDAVAGRLYARNMWNLARRYFYVTRNVKGGVRCGAESLRYDFDLHRLVHPCLHQAKLAWRSVRAVIGNSVTTEQASRPR